MSKSKDLFSDTTMSFGEHLEVLRMHLWKALIGLIGCVLVTLFFGQTIVAMVRGPIDSALKRHNTPVVEDVELDEFDFWEFLTGRASAASPDDEEAAEEPAEPELPAGTLRVQVSASDLADQMRKIDPDFPEYDSDKSIDLELELSSPAFARFQLAAERGDEAVTLNVQEAFLTYLKVAFVAGLVIASPWVFYQIWLFVAAGLYPHERKYVYIYLPVSTGLFLGGSLFCFFLVFPFVLDFLLGFNEMLGVNPQIRLSEWINFSIMLPVMFGASFQLPLVMLFLERISIFEVKDYREKRRVAFLVIAILSMIFTPADPMSMLLMMFPLGLLYELGILFCGFSPSKPALEPDPV